MHFTKNLNFLIKEHNKTVPVIANELNIKYESFRTYLKKSEPKYPVLIQIAEYFNISIDDLLRKDIEKTGYTKQHHVATVQGEVATTQKLAGAIALEKQNNNNETSIDALINKKIETRFEILNKELQELKLLLKNKK